MRMRQFGKVGTAAVIGLAIITAAGITAAGCDSGKGSSKATPTTAPGTLF